MLFPPREFQQPRGDVCRLGEGAPHCQDWRRSAGSDLGAPLMNVFRVPCTPDEPAGRNGELPGECVLDQFHARNLPTGQTTDHVSQTGSPDLLLVHRVAHGMDDTAEEAELVPLFELLDAMALRGLRLCFVFHGARSRA